MMKPGPNSFSFVRRQRGTSVFEFVLIMPAIVLVMLILIGMGHTLILRQHGLVAARYSAFYLRDSGTLPTSETVSHGISVQPEVWSVSEQPQDATGTFISDLELVAGEASNFFGSLVSQNGKQGSINAQVNHTRGPGIAPQILGSGNVSAHYTLPNGDWTNSCCGAFIPLLMKEVEVFGTGPHVSACNP